MIADDLKRPKFHLHLKPEEQSLHFLRKLSGILQEGRVEQRFRYVSNKRTVDQNSLQECEEHSNFVRPGASVSRTTNAGPPVSTKRSEARSHFDADRPKRRRQRQSPELGDEEIKRALGINNKGKGKQKADPGQSTLDL